ncbi:MAG TPA: transketolase C-terminal domain-containing protein [Bacteroidia bacterium]|mgnify:CR=1 FL=1|nr:transketolase C-terminal domain-containing protein [Bacteroidia bacterium]
MKEYPVINIKSTRAGFGDALFEVGMKNKDIVALSADLSDSVKMTKFRQAFPERFFQVGIAEANMIGIAAGLATGGKIPFTGTFANFSTGRVYDQIRQSVAYSKKNVKICASHSGLTVGEDGATHQILEDIGLMKMLPNMTVINTCDYNQTRQAVHAISDFDGPVYLRFGRPDVPNFIPGDMPFEIGKGIILNEGTDITVFATGHLVWKALLACKILEEKGISAEIINIHTIKPLDKELILNSVQKTLCAISVEEHQKSGGMGESIAALLSAELPVFFEVVGVNDVFGESGKPEELLTKFGLSENHIVEAALKILKKKTH